MPALAPGLVGAALHSEMRILCRNTIIKLVLLLELTKNPCSNFKSLQKYQQAVVNLVAAACRKLI